MTFEWLDPPRLDSREDLFAGSCALVDLATWWGLAPFEIAHPPCPLIGLGDASHPLAGFCDVIVARQTEAEALAAAVVSNPLAAAAAVQLLRLLPALNLAQGLIAESIAYAMLQGGAEHGGWLATNRARAGAPGRLVVERRGEILHLELDRTEVGNAIDRDLRDSLYEAFSLAALDPSIARIVLTGRGRNFCLGADLSEFGVTTDPAQAHRIRQLTLPATAIVRCADRLVVHIQGACIGAGLEMAAFARRITATPDAWFQLPELAMGIIPGAGGCVSLSRRIGRQRTGWMVLSGRRISARKALDWGLIDAIVDHAPGTDGGPDIG